MLSNYQLDFIEEIKNPNGARCAVVDAKAGSGKTYTLEQAAKEMRGTQMFVAFGKAIAEELARRGLNASTVHALGMRACNFGLGRARLNKYKSSEILQSLGFEKADWAPMQKLNSLGRAHLIGTNTPQAKWDDIVEHFDVTVSEKALERGFWPNFGHYYSAMFSTTQGIDFDDMVSLPIYNNWPIPQFDWVMVDESQDLNQCRLEFVFRMLKPTSRLVCVGDPNQAIYGFTGAMNDSMEQIKIKATENCMSVKTLPLSICYRCSQSVIREAQTIVPDIEWAPGAEEGSVQSIVFDDLFAQVKAADAILCRTVAPLVEACFALIRTGRRAMIKGKDIGDDLAGMVDRIAGRGTVSILNFIPELERFKIKQVEKLMAAKREMQAEAIIDKCETLLVLCEDSENIYDLKKKITDIFSDAIPENTITCSSAHKSKGLEWDTVFIIRPELMPHPSAKKEWQAQQEHNLKYVAITRSKKHLKWVSGKPKKNQK